MTERLSSFVGSGFLADPTSGEAVTIIGKRGHVSAFSEPHHAQYLRQREAYAVQIGTLPYLALGIDDEGMAVSG